MLILEVTYLTGRVHATPWGHHVNEGLVEWPPSPWRVLRALLATGFGRLGWSQVPPEARQLVEQLADAPPPTYSLPPATVAHTRHYMPLRELDKSSKQSKTTKVIDAFAHVDGPLCMAFDVELGPAEIALLDRLLDLLPYLGRAESWVCMRRASTVNARAIACRPSATGETPPGVERVRVLAPIGCGAYAAWREEALAAETVRAEQSAGGRLTKAKKEVLAKAFPEDLVACLLQETSALQGAGKNAGWNQLPGSRWVDYDRPLDALRALPARFAAPRSAPDGATTVLFALSSDTERGTSWPAFGDAVRRLDALHDALVKGSDRGDGRGPAPCFTGDLPVRDHRHASLIPLSLMRRGRLDHVLLHAPMGLDDPRVHEALASVRRIYAKNLPPLFIVVAGIGRAEDFADVVPVVGASAVLRSHTPFVPPRHLKPRGRNTLFGQIQAELESRCLPPARSVEVRQGENWAPVEPDSNVTCRSSLLRGFRRERDSRPPPTRAAFDLRLHFEEPVLGPVSLGYASHFGLGAFVPER